MVYLLISHDLWIKTSRLERERRNIDLFLELLARSASSYFLSDNDIHTRETSQMKRNAICYDRSSSSSIWSSTRIIDNICSYRNVFNQTYDRISYKKFSFDMNNSSLCSRKKTSPNKIDQYCLTNLRKYWQISNLAYNRKLENTLDQYRYHSRKLLMHFQSKSKRMSPINATHTHCY